MTAAEIEMIYGHLEKARERHPVAAVVTADGEMLCGDVETYGLDWLMLTDSLTRERSRINLHEARRVTIIALSMPTASFGASGPVAG